MNSRKVSYRIHARSLTLQVKGFKGQVIRAVPHQSRYLSGPLLRYSAICTHQMVADERVTDSEEYKTSAATAILLREPSFKT